MQHENTHPATRTTDRMQPTACNLQTRRQRTYTCKQTRCNGNLPCATDRMQRAALPHATHTHTCKREDATSKTDTMQQAELQHATCKPNRLQRCNMELRPATCNMRSAQRRMQQTQQIALQCAGYTTQHDDMQRPFSIRNRRHATAT